MQDFVTNENEEVDEKLNQSVIQLNEFGQTANVAKFMRP